MHSKLLMSKYSLSAMEHDNIGVTSIALTPTITIAACAPRTLVAPLPMNTIFLELLYSMRRQLSRFPDTSFPSFGLRWPPLDTMLVTANPFEAVHIHRELSPGVSAAAPIIPAVTIHHSSCAHKRPGFHGVPRKADTSMG